MPKTSNPYIDDAAAASDGSDTEEDITSSDSEADFDKVVQCDGEPVNITVTQPLAEHYGFQIGVAEDSDGNVRFYNEADVIITGTKVRAALCAEQATPVPSEPAQGQYIGSIENPTDCDLLMDNLLGACASLDLMEADAADNKAKKKKKVLANDAAEETASQKKDAPEAKKAAEKKKKEGAEAKKAAEKKRKGEAAEAKKAADKKRKGEAEAKKAADKKRKEDAEAKKASAEKKRKETEGKKAGDEKGKKVASSKAAVAVELGAGAELSKPSAAQAGAKKRKQSTMTAFTEAPSKRSRESQAFQFEFTMKGERDANEFSVVFKGASKGDFEIAQSLAKMM